MVTEYLFMKCNKYGCLDKRLSKETYKKNKKSVNVKKKEKELWVGEKDFGMV